MCLLSKINVLTLFIQIKIYFDSQKWLFYCDLLDKNLIFFEVMCVLIFTLVQEFSVLAQKSKITLLNKTYTINKNFS